MVSFLNDIFLNQMRSFIHLWFGPLKGPPAVFLRKDRGLSRGLPLGEKVEAVLLCAACVVKFEANYLSPQLTPQAEASDFCLKADIKKLSSQSGMGEGYNWCQVLNKLSLLFCCSGCTSVCPGLPSQHSSQASALLHTTENEKEGDRTADGEGRGELHWSQPQTHPRMLCQF